MKKVKFKAGDKVVVFKSGSDVCRFTGMWIREMEHRVGKEFTIREIEYKGTPDDCRIGYRFVEDPFLWDERVLRSANEKDLIVVYRDGSKVVALNKKTGEKGVARCNPNDTFDFDTGARIAFDRLIGRDEKTPDNFFCGIEVVCTECIPPAINAKTGVKYFTVGKTYRLKDGCIVDDGEFTWGSGLLDNIETLNAFFHHHCGNNDCYAVFKVKRPEEREEPKEPHVFYARCIEAKAPHPPAATDCGAFFTAGKVYKVVDGTITDEGGFTWGSKGSSHTASELSSYFVAGPYTARFCDATEREYKV